MFETLVNKVSAESEKTFEGSFKWRRKHSIHKNSVEEFVFHAIKTKL
jgi:hypothetical protein